MLASVPVTESTQAGEARRAALDAAREIGMDEELVGRVGIVASEMSTNLYKHVEAGGELLVNTINDHKGTGIELLALDRGRGIFDIGRSQVDGHSTTGTAGNGLGAMDRLADEFDIYTQPKTGTVVLARIWHKKNANDAVLQHAALSVPIRGETLCGDSCAYARTADAELFFVADGLGHGPHAFEAADAAKKIFLANADIGGTRIMEKMHAALRPTRGAAAAIAMIDHARQAVRFVGVGNISAAVVATDGKVSNMISHAGTLGHATRTITEFSYQWPGAGGVLVMHSDGIIPRWKVDSYPGILARDPAILAALIYRDCSRGRDDASVLIARQSLR